jgi:hypothetical protein
LQDYQLCGTCPLQQRGIFRKLAAVSKCRMPLDKTVLSAFAHVYIWYRPLRIVQEFRRIIGLLPFSRQIPKVYLIFSGANLRADKLDASCVSPLAHRACLPAMRAGMALAI